MESTDILFNSLKSIMLPDEFNNFIELWAKLKAEVFPLTDAPFPVKHGEKHITNVILKLCKLIDIVSRERVSKQFDENISILFYAAAIHDIGMRIVPLDTEQGIDSARKKHADFELIKRGFASININSNTLNDNIELICLLASSHANSFDKDNKLHQANEKIAQLESRFVKICPDIYLYSRLLQFADLIDIDEKRLNKLDPFIFKKRQFKHYYKHDLFTVEINGDSKIIALKRNSKITSLNQYELEELRKEICNDLLVQFERLNNYLTYGWKLIVPPSFSDIYFPVDRRIRIQASHSCNLKCKGCHHDQFNIRNIDPDYMRLVKLVNNIKNQDNGDNEIHPKPNISFTITGEEPFKNEYSKIRSIISATNTPNLIAGDKNSTYILTNASLLNPENISLLKEFNLNKIRISLNYNKYENGEGYIEKEFPRYDNIKALINSNSESEIRINHVVLSGKLDEITKVIKTVKDIFINDDENQSHSKTIISTPEIPKNIQEIGFIQNTNDNTYDIFDLAKEYYTTQRDGIRNHFTEGRKFVIDLHSNLRLSFIKLNCDVKTDFITRCFSCVREQDISISANSRIRLCSGWDENLNPKYQDIQFDIDYPLTGISNGIRKKYGIAGFYGHFATFVDVINNRKKIETNFEEYGLRNLIGEYKNNLPNNIDDILQVLINLLTNINSPFKHLYEEGIVEESDIDKTILLCTYLIKTIYKYAQNCKDIIVKIRINKILLILSYLSVDENLFSTPRTIIIKGISEKLLSLFNSEINRRERMSKEDELIFSTYCIATIALENIDSEIVLDYIKTILDDEKQLKFGQIPYLIGCIYRQSKQNDKAIIAFENAYAKSNNSLADEDNIWIDLNKEIRADSQRSLGAIKKNDRSKTNETQNHFLLSRYYASIDNTILKFHSLFSDGYSLLLRFFDEEFPKTNTAYQRGLGFEAYIPLKESLDINPVFYASLIRIALLDLAFQNYRSANERILVAHNTFHAFGLLTDQEYLNKVLSDLIFLYSKYKKDSAVIDVSIVNEFVAFNIKECRSVGIRDIECVMEDVNILWKIIFCFESTATNNTDLLTITRAIDDFLNECNDLIIRKKENLITHLKRKIDADATDPKEAEKIKNEIKEWENYDFLKKLKAKRHESNKVLPYEFHHVCIQTNKYQESLKFYTKYLGGILLLENKGFHGREFNTWILIGKIKIELQTPKNDQEFVKWSSLNCGPVHLCYVVEDVQKMYDRIKKIEHSENDKIEFKTKKDNPEIYEVKGNGFKTFKIFKVKAPEGTEIEIRENTNID